jgi:hypothetical protein
MCSYTPIIPQKGSPENLNKVPVALFMVVPVDAHWGSNYGLSPSTIFGTVPQNRESARWLRINAGYGNVPLGQKNL